MLLYASGAVMVHAESSSARSMSPEAASHFINAITFLRNFGAYYIYAQSDIDNRTGAACPKPRMALLLKLERVMPIKHAITSAGAWYYAFLHCAAPIHGLHTTIT